MSFFWTHQPKFTPNTFQRHPGIQKERTKIQTRIIQRMMLILNWMSLLVSPHKNSARTKLYTWWQMSTKRFHTAPLEGLQPAKQSTLYQPTKISKGHYSCDDRSRPFLVGPSTIGEQHHLCKLQHTHLQKIQASIVTHHNHTHIGREIWQVWTVWKLFPNKAQGS